jgi:transaldolase
MATVPMTNLRLTTELGVDFWNDSCDLAELEEAVREGAVGATSNPVIVGQAVEAQPDRWLPVVDAMIEARPAATEDEIAWALVETMAREAAQLLSPVHRASRGRKGYLCVQVDPRLHRDAARMTEHGLALAAIARNIAVKVPATEAGAAAVEELTARGVRINATVCFTVAQAVACAEAVERGLARAQADGRDVAALFPNVTVMVGRLDDHLRRVLDRGDVAIEPGFVHWAGIAVFKKVASIFRARGFRAVPLAAAYRHHLHWTELIGEGVVLTMPYAWWRRFNASSIRPRPSLEEPVREPIVADLRAAFEDFRKAYDEDAMPLPEFVRYGPSVHTLQQFLGGYDRLVGLVRGRMLR